MEVMACPEISGSPEIYKYKQSNKTKVQKSMGVWKQLQSTD